VKQRNNATPAGNPGGLYSAQDQTVNWLPLFRPTQRLGAAGLTPGKPVILPAISPRRRWIGIGSRVKRGVVSLRSHTWPLRLGPEELPSPAAGSGGLFLITL